MGSSYIQEFDIHEIFSVTDMQKILIGASKKNKDEFVVINIMNDKRFLGEETKRQLQCLDNLVFFEELDEAIVLVTKFNKASYLTEYIEQNMLNTQERLSLAHQYLEKIVAYDNFSDDIKRILVEESQVIVKDGSILLNDLLIVGKNVIDKDDSFKRVSRGVGSVLNTILFSNISLGDKKLSELNKLLELVNNLQYGTHQYTSLNEILKAYNQLYPDVANHNDGKTEEILQEEHKQLRHTTFKKAIIGIVLTGVIAALLVMGIGGRFKNTDGVIEIQYSWEESNEATVADGDQENDRYGNETDKTASEGLEKYEISNLNPDFIKKDRSIFRNGEYALKFMGTTDNASNSIYLNNVTTYKNSTLSLWVRTDAIEEIPMNFKGYNHDHLVWENFIYYKPKVAGTWEMIHFDLPNKESNRIKLSLFNANTTVWIDDIKISSYK
ncbi:hypothetical protein [Clostridium formicaceticum]|uniref:Uncharacterized protein n=1 Tax=Clostridium formicaceticum TaxID=1497 RepID=A0AAC9WF50_9CLOT|nr:hypothetical protein [Clostridium formicaceticum]AOY76134.1 hypothetical protein BJL90_09605 [Clostridium formicaceticum]ARE86502.1 hypothetical protein CLFO_08240 [Clostridium formicaceticum]